MTAQELDVRVKDAGIDDAVADLVVVGVWKGATEAAGDGAALDASAGGDVKRLIASGDFEGAFGDKALVYPREGSVKRVLVLGLGEEGKLTVDRVRQLGARVAKQARDVRAVTAATPLLGAGAGDVTADAAARALAEGAVMALYKFTRFKTAHAKDADAKKDKPALKRLIVHAPNAGKRVKDAVKHGVTVGRAVNRAREWATVSGPAGLPAALAEEAREAAESAGLAVTVLDEKRLAKDRFGGVMAVSQGSPHPPRFVTMEHGKTHAKKGTLVLVGKGVTFDSGGISIKGAEKMDEMKFDKAGAAAVWGAMLAIAAMKLPVHVVALTPLVENMPSGSAIKPGDVYTAFDGSTVEILNTDAEGRLILADAVAYAERYAPDAIIDIATLTGHVVVAFGHHVTGLMGNDPWLLTKVEESALRVNEPVHSLPFLPAYGKLLESDVADIKNHGGRPAGAITAGKFIEHFVPKDVPWAHLDVAGTAWSSGKVVLNPEYTPGQATGVGVRTFVDLAEHWSLGEREKNAAAPARKKTASGTSRKKTASGTSRKKTTRSR